MPELTALYLADRQQLQALRARACGRRSTRAGASRTAPAPSAPSRGAPSRRASSTGRRRRTSTRTSPWRRRLAAGLWGIEHAQRAAAAGRGRRLAARGDLAPLPRTLREATAASPRSEHARAASSARPSSTTTCARATGSAASTSAPSPSGSCGATSRSSDECAWHPSALIVLGLGHERSLVTWSFPTTIVFGAGAVAHASADHVKRIGATRALVVCDAGVVKVGIAERVRGAARGGRRRGGGLRRGRPEPGREERRRRRRGLPARTRADVIVAVGGGSPLDAGQAHRAQGHPRPAARRLRRRDRRRPLHRRRTSRPSSPSRRPPARAARSGAPAS